jgi:uncharacterized protein (TIGR00645 family)
MGRIADILEKIIFASRWILAPMYFCLVAALLILTAKFVQDFWHLLLQFQALNAQVVVISILELVDVVLVANLLLMIIFSGYENFVSKIEAAKSHIDRPSWMGKIGYSGLKQKIIGSIVAISSIELLKIFINFGSIDYPPSIAEEAYMRWKLICMGSLHGIDLTPKLGHIKTEVRMVLVG